MVSVTDVAETSEPVPVDNLVNTTIGRMRYNRRTRQRSASITITNTSSTAITNPILVIESLTGTGVSVEGTDGTTSDGKRYIDLRKYLSDDKLDPGESLSINLIFLNPSRRRFSLELGVRGII